MKLRHLQRSACSGTGLESRCSEHQLKPQFMADKGLQSCDFRRLKATPKNGARCRSK